MKVQSLSVVVPNKVCINKCESCPSRMHDWTYPILLEDGNPDFDLYLAEYLKRLEYARDNGCNVLMLTGTSEPQQNRKFLLWFGMLMKLMKNPFRNIEMQCTGVLLDENYLKFLRRHVGVATMALSVFALDKEANMRIINPPKNSEIDPVKIAKMVKDADMNLRMCLNLTKEFDCYKDFPASLFTTLKKGYQADQITFRVLYAGDDEKPENVWVRENAASLETVRSIMNYVKEHGTKLRQLPYGAYQYGVDGMSVVIDDDCMGKHSEDPESLKYLILRPDCHLYSSWDTPASRVF